MIDYERTIISQYASAETLMAWIADFNEWIDPSVNIDAFYELVMDIDTAQGWGLDVWGRIVGVGRVLQVQAGDYFGFEEGDSYESFGHGPFYSGAPVTSNYALSDDAFRLLILAKALANITNCSIPAINQILLSLFPGRGNCYVTDGEDMTMTYTFEFTLTDVETAIVENSGVLPRPVGVAATVVQP